MAKDDKTKRIALTRLTPDPRNPRTMRAEARDGLGESLERFGDLSGIVFNDRTQQLVGAHQRLERLRAAGAIEVVRQGAEGYIEHPKTGERFRVRFVDWDENTQRLANLTANNRHIAGEFTADAATLLKELEDLDGFADLQLGVLEEEIDRVFGIEGDEDATDDEGGRAGDQSGELRTTWQIVITCADEKHQAVLLQRFTEEGLKCRALI